MMGKQGKHSKDNSRQGTSAKKPQDSTSPATGTEPQTEDTPSVEPITSTALRRTDDFPGVY